MSNKQKFQPKYLGKQHQEFVTKFDLIPWKGNSIIVTLNCNEFTSNCPVSGAPDFAKFIIEYVPDEYIVETKSMKLYLWQFRNKKEFNETLVDFIATDFFKQVQPKKLKVVGEFYQRGGISVTPTAYRGSWNSKKEN